MQRRGHRDRIGEGNEDVVIPGQMVLRPAVPLEQGDLSAIARSIGLPQSVFRHRHAPIDRDHQEIEGEAGSDHGKPGQLDVYGHEHQEHGI
jgi:hypothetical protein